jgi:hypothetical protein
MTFEVHQEEDFVASRRLVRISVIAVSVGGIGVFFAGVLLAATTHANAPPAFRAEPPRNVAQTPIFTSRSGLDRTAAQRRELERWGWVDRQRGIAKIPIGEAIDILVQDDLR